MVNYATDMNETKNYKNSKTKLINSVYFLMNEIVFSGGGDFEKKHNLKTDVMLFNTLGFSKKETENLKTLYAIVLQSIMFNKSVYYFYFIIIYITSIMKEKCVLKKFNLSAK